MERKRIFDLFIEKAQSWGWAGDTAMLWSAWKRVVWPYITGAKEW